MTLRFCSCGGYLIPNADVSLTFECVACTQSKKANPDDSLLYEEVATGTVASYDVLIKTAAKDRLNPTVKKYCGKCKKETYVNFIYLGQNMAIIYSCLDCNFQWSA